MARRGRQEPGGDERPPEPAADPVAVAREIVLRLLTLRARSRAELADALGRRGVPDEVTAEVLDRFAEVGLIDDVAFAAQWVESGKRRSRSRSTLRRELRGKGVNDELVREAVSSVSDGDEYEAAVALAHKRAAATMGLAEPVRYRRVAGALARRGFGADVTHRALREALSGGSLSDEPEPY